MSLFRVGGRAFPSFRTASRHSANVTWRPSTYQSCTFLQTRSQHNRPPKSARNPSSQTRLNPQQQQQQYAPQEQQYDAHALNNYVKPKPLWAHEYEELGQTPPPPLRVRYIRPAIWAILVSGGIFTGLAYLQAKQELNPNVKPGWPTAPQWTRGPPSPTEVATKYWETLNPMSRLGIGIIAANTTVHLSSLVMPRVWASLWHMPARNVNYTQFTSMFVHSGPLHLFVNMYCTYNFMTPVGYSAVFEGDTYHVLSFFLATGVLSGMAQHWSTLITTNKRAVPEIFIRCGGASGALLGLLGVFCTQYPHAGLGIMFVPIHFEAQYVMPAFMLFDLVGVVWGYKFVNLGHAAHLAGASLGIAYTYYNGRDRLWKPLVRFWRKRLQAQR